MTRMCSSLFALFAGDGGGKGVPEGEQILGVSLVSADNVGEGKYATEAVGIAPCRRPDMVIALSCIPAARVRGA